MSLQTTFSWFTSSKIKNEHSKIKVNQVYVWLKTKDNKIILVSKDGNRWQFPGGHLDEGEILEDTAARELYEEAGIDVSDFKDKLSFFGYYLVSEPDSTNTTLVNIVQTRFLLDFPFESQELTLKPQEKDSEPEEKKIHFVRAVSIDEACELIGWLGASDELNAFKQIIHL